ncbi:class I SAM-dependent methyltransferase [Alicyclobacillus fastidiosus]|uniref:Class I SAM-dependent methyltransferase n=1 Tax=Alicyclobacillus fastidiosus TaxID=392011 RepID=A0ABY6ZMH7_9BACL|nr:class I SAM-dependent methyltransferase [Alicyclobacillus fastidiosus]WAH44057.1 class I SAM-dependent methyltransferase [Alicyclobacillus fastidiosus]GMA60344.1 methyltransferase type 11 [Alicyclobacillus fastidiosus]
MGHRFDPKHVEKLDNLERRKMLPPNDIVKMLDVQQGHTVADIGCGPGYFTIPLARLPRTVYAVDVSPEMLHLLKERAAYEELENITLVESPAEHTTLPDHSVDRVICSLVLHEVDDLKQTLSEFKRILRPGGRVLLIEWEKKPMEMGPPLEERLSAESLLREAEALGLHGEISYPNPNQYIIVAQ